MSKTRGKRSASKAKFRVKVEDIHFTQLDRLPPAPRGTVRVVNYGSKNGRVGRPRKGGSPFGLVL